MSVPTSMADLSTTANINSPAGSKSPISADDFLRAIQSILRHTNAKGADIASATTTDIGAATGEFVDVTGTTTITGLGTIAAGIERTVRFTGALTLTHNATSLILPGGANITTAANDMAVFRSLGSGNWLCVVYQKANGTPLDNADASDTAKGVVELLTEAEYETGTDTTRALTAAVARAKNIVSAAPITTTSGTSHDFTGIPSWVKKITVGFNGVSINAAGTIMVQLGDSAGIEATGYSGATSTISTVVVTDLLSSGFFVQVVGGAGGLLHGSLILTQTDASTNTWTANGVTGRSDAAVTYVVGGTKSLSATLDRIRLTTTSGTATFDAGSFNIQYE